MALSTYCAFDEVRAALGVNADEVSDAVIGLPVYEIGLMRELQKVASALPASFLTAYAADPRSEAQTELVNAVRMFSVYSAARQVGVSLGAMAPKDVGDGKATLSRFADAPYKDVLSRVEAMSAMARETLASVWADFNGSDAPVASTTPLAAFRVSKRGYDPITGA